MEEAKRAWQSLNTDIVACRLCPRLVAWRERVAIEKRRAFRDWDYWGRPVPGFGDTVARVLILGLAPGAHGANRTGRMFTGDSSGDTLTAAMFRAGFANQPNSSHREDGLVFSDVFLTAVARCVPPGNRPTAQEITNCQPFLIRELELLSRLQLVIALGRIAFDGYRRLLRGRGIEVSKLIFSHGAHYHLDPSQSDLIVCYHPSRQNTQTGRLTDAMIDEVFAHVRMLLA